MKLPADRHLDPRWNACLDALTEEWGELGPDVTLAVLTLLAEPGDAKSAATEEGGSVMLYRPLAEVTQSILYDPDLNARGVYGNCLQAAVASALGLDLDAVPHFAAFTWWDAAARLWLRGRGLDWSWVPAGRGRPGGRCVVVGQSPRRAADRHAVAGEGGRIAWDPHPSRDGLSEVQGAYVFRPWPGGAAGDGRCVCCAGQLAVLAAARKGAA